MSRKLLLADDSITIQKVIGITFANEDYQLTVVDNGDSALEKARLDRPDLVLADIFMPGKNGYELCAAIKADPNLAQVPVLLLSGTFEPFDEQKARDAGADSWISKPFESQALIERVEGLLIQKAAAAPATTAPQPVAQPEPATAPVAPVVAPTPAPMVATPVAAAQPAWDDALAADPWDDNGGWGEEETAAPLKAVADPWQGLDDAAAPVEEDFSWDEPVAPEPEKTMPPVAVSPTPAAPVEEEFSWDEPVAPAPEKTMPSAAVSPTPAASVEEDFSWDEPVAPAPEKTIQPAAVSPSAALASDDEEDLWGSVSFGDEDLLGDFGASPVSGKDAPVPQLAASSTPVGPVDPVDPAVSSPVAVAAGSGPAVIEWEDDEDIMPLDDLEILEEEDIFEEDDSGVAAAPPVPAAAEPMPADAFGFAAEDRGLALEEMPFEQNRAADPFAMVDEESAADPFAMADEESAAEPFAMEDAWETSESPQIEVNPMVRELLGTSLQEPDWSSEVSGGAVELDEEDFLRGPASRNSPAPPAAPVAAPLSVEQVTASLKEEDIAALVEKVAAAVVERLAGSVLERIVWEVVPDMAEGLIKDEIRRIKEEVQ